MSNVTHAGWRLVLVELVFKELCTLYLHALVEGSLLDEEV